MTGTNAKSTKITNDKIVWLDMEMTGLNPDECHILEIACLITDKNLKQLSTPFHTVIYQPPHVMETLNDWCKIQHKKSGLIKESQESKVTLNDAEFRLLQYLKEHTNPGGCPLAGNTVHMDKMFLMKYMPKVVDLLHYRVIDVSSIHELCWRWYPNYKPPKKSRRHRALPDIKDSLKELQYLRQNYFINQKSPDPPKNKKSKSDPEDEDERTSSDMSMDLLGT